LLYKYFPKKRGKKKIINIWSEKSAAFIYLCPIYAFATNKIHLAVRCYYGRGLAGSGIRVRTHPHYSLHDRCTWPHTEGRCVGTGEPALEQVTKRKRPHMLA
jgi:hypothetical protein